MAKEDEEAIKASLTTMVETITTTIGVKAKTTKIGNDIPMTRISSVIYMEGGTVQKIVLYSRGRLVNSSHHLAKVSNASCTAIISPTSTIANSSPMSLACLSTTFKLLIRVLIHPLG